jgi:hypothetical protein
MDRDERLDVFKNIYENNLWGHPQEGRRYYSHSIPEYTKPFREYISSFIRDHDDVKRVVDLGCGDFVAASGIDFGDAHYVGTDIYAALVEDTSNRFGNERREFVVCDLVEDDLPPGDLCLITMVLFLLSNDEAMAVTKKLRQYRYVLITDGQADIPESERRNIDKKTDKYTRRDYYNNCFYLELPPFNLSLTVVSEYKIPAWEWLKHRDEEGVTPTYEILRTVLIEHPDA